MTSTTTTHPPASTEPGEAALVVGAESPLRASDRCDRCPSRAYGRVTLRAGGVLLFCGHHLGKHLDTLKRTAVSIEDFRPALAAEEKS